VQISSNLFGLFFEEINSAGDGGLYAELVRNRVSRNRAIRITGFSSVRLGNRQFDPRLHPAVEHEQLNAARLTFSSGSGTVAWRTTAVGMNLQAGQTYDLSFHARRSAGSPGR